MYYPLPPPVSPFYNAWRGSTAGRTSYWRGQAHRLDFATKIHSFGRITERAVCGESWPALGSVSSQRLSHQGGAGVRLRQCVQVAGLEQMWRGPIRPGGETGVSFHSVTRQYTTHCVTLLHCHTGTLCYTVTLSHAHCVMLQYTYCIAHQTHMYIWQVTSCYTYIMAHCHITCVATQCTIVH